MEIALNETSMIVASKGQVATDLGEEVVILDLGAGRYYGLNGVGASAWKMVQQPNSIAAMRTELLEEYQVDGERCLADLLEFFGRLLDKGLVEIVAPSAE